MKSGDDIKKNVLVVTGFESSGSVFLARIASFVLGKCSVFGQWNGYGWNGKAGDDLIVIHRSMPYGRNPKKWFDALKDELAGTEGYDFKYVICTRDLTISGISRRSRFGGTLDDCKRDDEKARAIFRQIMVTETYYIFSFESALALGADYYRDFYRWLNVTSDFEPPLFDANQPYIRGKTGPTEASRLKTLLASLRSLGRK